MNRTYYRSHDLTLSYLDYGQGSDAPVLLLLHGHFGTARSMLAPLAESLDGWRVIALDQRGHGWSEHAADLNYSRDSYVADIHALVMQELGGRPVVILGHSLGGVNAYQFAAKYPHLVKALLIEDIGAEVRDDLSYASQFPVRANSLRELQRQVDGLLGAGAFGYFAESVLEDDEGWGFRFHAEGMIASQQQLNGLWWDDWLATSCPALLLHGGNSRILSEAHAEEMAARRANTSVLHVPECGHTIHDADPDKFRNAVRTFLDKLIREELALENERLKQEIKRLRGVHAAREAGYMSTKLREALRE